MADKGGNEFTLTSVFYEKAEENWFHTRSVSFLPPSDTPWLSLVTITWSASTH